MVNDAIGKMRDVFGYVLVGAAALYAVSGLSVLFKGSEDFFGASGNFGDKAFFASNLFGAPLALACLVGALALAVVPQASKAAKNVVLGVLAVGAVHLLFALICFFAAFGASEEMADLSTGEGKIAGIWSGLAELAVLGVTCYAAFLVFSALPKAASSTGQQGYPQGQQQWGAQAAGYNQSHGQQQWGGHDQSRGQAQQWGQAGQQPSYDGQQQWTAGDPSQQYGQQQSHGDDQYAGQYGQQQWGQAQQWGQPASQGDGHYGQQSTDQGHQYWGQSSDQQPEPAGATGWGAAGGGEAASQPDQQQASGEHASQHDESQTPTWYSQTTDEPAGSEHTEYIGAGSQEHAAPASDEGEHGAPVETQAWQASGEHDDAQQPPQQGWWNQPPQR